MTTTAGHSFYIGPIGSFHNQVKASESLWLYKKMNLFLTYGYGYESHLLL
jgi:hypothetical protein